MRDKRETGAKKMKNRYKIALAVPIGVLIAVILVWPYAIHYTVIIHESIGINTRMPSNVFFELNGAALFSIHNNMTEDGQKYINWDLFNSSYTQFRFLYIAIGTGPDTDPHNNTALDTELDRQAATYYRPGGDYTYWGLNYTFSFAGSYTITEAGILSAASNGVLGFYINTISIGVTAADTLKISWQGRTYGY